MLKAATDCADFDAASPIAGIQVGMNRCCAAVQNLFDRDQLSIAQRRGNLAARIFELALFSEKFSKIGLHQSSDLYNKLVYRAVNAQAKGIGLKPLTFEEDGSGRKPDSRGYFDLGMYCTLGVLQPALMELASTYLKLALEKADNSRNRSEMSRIAAEEISRRANRIVNAVQRPGFRESTDVRDRMLLSAGKLYECAAKVTESRKEEFDFLCKARLAYEGCGDRTGIAHVNYEMMQLDPAVTAP